MSTQTQPKKNSALTMYANQTAAKPIKSVRSVKHSTRDAVKVKYAHDFNMKYNISLVQYTAAMQSIINRRMFAYIQAVNTAQPHTDKELRRRHPEMNSIFDEYDSNLFNITSLRNHEIIDLTTEAIDLATEVIDLTHA